jgi:hypothetical protein
MVMRWKLAIARHIRCASAAVNPAPASSLAALLTKMIRAVSTANRESPMIEA